MGVRVDRGLRPHGVEAEVAVQGVAQLAAGLAGWGFMGDGGFFRGSRQSPCQGYKIERIRPTTIIMCTVYHIYYINYVLYIRYQTSDIIYHIPYIIHHISCVIYHISYIMYHISYTLYYIFHIIYYIAYYMLYCII